ncbi:MAG: hypothetical protein Q8T13_23385 [Acidobacteriota bacterium]|nr:hypothetical protein [Acidobacteriota bacterium]
MKKTRYSAVPILAMGLMFLCSLGLGAATGSSTPAFERVVARFNTNAPPAYRAFRRLEAGVAGSSRHGWLEAWTELRPGTGLNVEVVAEGGNEYVRNKILRKMLVNEQQLIARGFPLRAPLEARNYTFEDGGTTPEGLQRIVLKAARKSDGVVNGALFISPTTGSVTRLEGRLVKSPSFWVRDVDVTWQYALIDGHLLPVEMTSTGRVRMIGRSTFKMVYNYVSIQGRPRGRGVMASLSEKR